MIQKSTRLQLFIGLTGTGLIFFLWKISSPYLSAILSTDALRFINIVSILSLCVPPLLVMVFAKDRLSEYAFPLKNLIRQIGTGVGIGLGMAVVLTLIPILLGMEAAVYSGPCYRNVSDAIRGLVYFIFIVGLSEEFIFRGFLYEKLDECCISDGIPVLLSSALFGLFHLSGPNLIQVFLTGIIGAFFCICKQRIPCCTVLSLAVAHGIHDWMIRILVCLL